MQEVNIIINRLKAFRKELPKLAIDAFMENEAEIIDIITEEQLYSKGIDGYGDRLDESAPYTPFTIRIKTSKNQPADRVTLKDTGEFHESIELIRKGNTVRTFSANELFEDLKSKYGDGIINLTDENLQKVIIEYIEPYLYTELKTII